MSTPLSGRKAQAARNDEVILTAARAVFLDDPGAPIAAVAERAHVGISALYRRYPSKEELLRKLCSDGLAAYIAATQAAVDELDAGGDAWQVFAGFMRRVIDAGSTSLTIRLAGTFTPDEQLYRDAQHADDLNRQLIKRIREAGAIRDDIEVADIGLILEQIASVRLGDDARTGELRHRYLALILQGLSHPDPRTLPGPPPRPEELAARWTA
ncbi:TetR/AcrR family transcriptional regulator [Phytohabitans sp. LJ34]|uniref:TetR/AcrR family transcriptional regulator n=1 Tax=Phytohabitans sp. LJ34 TaxID=3452217 RepID=UPI003F8B15DE